MTRITLRRARERPDLIKRLRPVDPAVLPTAGSLVVTTLGDSPETGYNAWFIVRPRDEWNCPGSVSNNCYEHDWDDPKDTYVLAPGCHKRRSHDTSHVQKN